MTARSVESKERQFYEFFYLHKSDLHKYCRLITKSDWDADDLFQETTLKLYNLFRKADSLHLSKAYLFKMATNTWIDVHRKTKGTFCSDRLLDHLIDAQETSKLKTRETIEALIDQLPPRQVVIILLIDVFQFTAKEVAHITNSTIGATKAALHRAREALRLSQRYSTSVVGKKEETRDPAFNKNKLIEAFVQAFREQNVQAINQAYLQIVKNGLHVEVLDKGDKIYLRFKDPDGNMFMIATSIPAKND